MVRKVTIRNFKRFSSESFELLDSVVLAGPNNSGKSTLLQAIATWKFGLSYWSQRRSGSKARRRTGVPITRAELSTVPLREMNLLWESRQVAPRAAEPGNRRLIEISVNGEASDGPWACGLEFQYTNSEMLYVRPLNASKLAKDEIAAFPPTGASELNVVSVPALSGIRRDEPRFDRGLQDLLVGQGRSGEILRNLLLDIPVSEWAEFAELLRGLFDIDLIRPAYSPTDPYIICEYRDPNSRRPLDLSNAGSGTLQALLLFAFLYARPSSVMLLDEPDAHQHVILQRRVYGEILRLCRKRHAQLILATHSDVVLDATDPARVYAFFGTSSRPLVTKIARDRLREAMKRLTTTDLLQGQDVGAVLYVEGPTDVPILAAWARVLDHPASAFFDRPFVVQLGGRRLREANSHYFALRAAFPEMPAICLFDGDNRDDPESEVTKAGLTVLRWNRYEIENYLLDPEAIAAFWDFPLLQDQIEAAFWKQVPRGTNLFSNHVALARVKASDEFLLPLFRELGKPVNKRDLVGIAEVMAPSQIHPEVIDKLDRLAATLTTNAATG